MSVFLERIRTALRANADLPAFVCPDETMTYGDAYLSLLRLYRAYGAAGIGSADLVALPGRNRPDTILAQLAAQLLGASVLLVAESASDPDRAALVANTGVTATPTPIPGGSPGANSTGSPAEFRPGGKSVDAGRVMWTTAAPEPSELPPSVHTVFGSGGTTGKPKLIAHRGIYDGMAHVFQPDPIEPKRILVTSPLSHLTGNCAVLGALLAGDTVVLHDGFDAGAVLRAIERERVTHLSLTPPRLAAVLDHPDRMTTDLSTVHGLSTGASPLPVARLRQAQEVFGPVLGQGYGLTEAPMVASIAPADYEGHPERLASVGRIVPGMEARISGDDPVGEILVRGLALMEGYHNDPAATEHAMGDGWLRTGDLGRFDADGYLYLLGRADDVVITGEHGTKVHPSIVEDALTAHPRVRQAAVFGVPGPYGDRLHATVVVTGDVSEDTLREHLRTTLGRAHLVPETVTFAETLPLTPVGKIDKSALTSREWPSKF